MTTKAFNLTDPSLAVPLVSGRHDRSTVLAWIDVLYAMLYDVDPITRDGATLFIRSIALDVGHTLPVLAGRLFIRPNDRVLSLAFAEMPCALERMGMRLAVTNARTVICDIANSLRIILHQKSAAA